MCFPFFADIFIFSFKNTHTFRMSNRRFTAFACLFTLAGCSLCACSQTEISAPPPSAPIEESSVEQIPAPLPQEHPEFWEDAETDLSKVQENRKLVALTFDDAPRNKLENLLAVFTSFNERNPNCHASATVFCNGNLLDDYTRSVLHTALVAGWELGNHTQNHLDLTALSEKEQRFEVDSTDTLLQAVDGKARHLLRAPFGRIDDRIRALANAPIIDWTVDTRDWTGVSAETIVQETISKIYAGAIVLMHDGFEQTVEAVKTLLPALKSAGYQAVSVSVMAKAHACKLRNGSVYIRARKRGKA